MFRVGETGAQPEMLGFEVWLGQSTGWGSSPPLTRTTVQALKKRNQHLLLCNKGVVCAHDESTERRGKK